MQTEEGLEKQLTKERFLLRSDVVLEKAWLLLQAASIHKGPEDRSY